MSHRHRHRSRGDGAGARPDRCTAFATRWVHRRWLRGAATVVALVLSTVQASAGPCGSWSPTVNKSGFRAGATVPWTTGDSPGGAPFPNAMLSCVARAFAAWSAANETSGSRVRFTPGVGGIVVRFDKAGGLILADRRAGAWSDAVRGTDGALERASIWITSDPALVASCHTVTKVVLHELGHLHGLADNPHDRGPSVMNHLGGPNDHRAQVPAAPTDCDAAQAAQASAGSARNRWWRKS
jgi:hypothetical protein